MKHITNAFYASLLAANLTTADPVGVFEDGHWFDINGEKTHYIDRGQGQAVVLIHGLGADLSRWQNNIDALAKSHRVIAIDLLGFGQSSKPNIDYRGQVFVDQVISLLQHLHIESATFIGNSMGGWVSLLVAEQHPERVEKLVLVAPAFVFGLPPGINAQQLTDSASPQTVDAMTIYLDRIYHRSPASRDEVYAQKALAEKIAKGDHETIASVAQSLEKGTDRFDQQRLQSLATNTLIIHGDSDGIVPLDASRKLQSLLQNATLEVIKNAGHWPQLEQADAFMESLQ